MLNYCAFSLGDGAIRRPAVVGCVRARPAMTRLPDRLLTPWQPAGIPPFAQPFRIQAGAGLA